jgi:hypothetical protein
MPVVVRTRDYDEEFYASIGVLEGNAIEQSAKRGSDTLFGE